MSTTTTRRAILAGAAAATTAAAITTTATAALPGPHPDVELVELFAGIARNNEAYRAMADDDDATEARLEAELNAIDDAIIATPAATVVGVLVKLRLLHMLEVPKDGPLIYLTERLIASLLPDVERLAEAQS